MTAYINDAALSREGRPNKSDLARMEEIGWTPREEPEPDPTPPTDTKFAEFVLGMYRRNVAELEGYFNGFN